MRPLDPRLLRCARATGRFLGLSVVIGSITAVAIVVQAALLAEVITDVFSEGADLAAVTPAVTQLAAVVLLRAVLAFLTEWSAFHSVARAKSQLRSAVLDHVIEQDPAGSVGLDAGEFAQLLGRGVDALDNYFARYLPQLVLAVIVPVVIAVVIATQDLLAAVIIAATIPLIPVFMVLVGRYTRGHMDQQWATLGVLSNHFLDVVAGLPTLKVFGRARAQAITIKEVGEHYRVATMGVLRISFLSALVLELLATLSVALVAVSIGLRLVNGELTLEAGLLVLILAPEAYLPIRMVGTQFHAAADGIAASGRLLDILDEPILRHRSREPGPWTAPVTIMVSDLRFSYRGRSQPAVSALGFVAAPGRILALAGPSGAGKSTVLQLVLAMLTPGTGAVAVNGIRVSSIDPRSWWELVGWLPQRPVLVAGTVADNIRLGRPDADDVLIRDAADRAGLLQASTGDVLRQRVHESGGVSVGQVRRIALARVILRDAPVVLLDEPSAALDADTESVVASAIRRFRDDGRTVVLVAHRPALLALADDTVHLSPPLAELDAAPIRAGHAWDRLPTAVDR